MTATNCKNCGLALQGTYCHDCGEKVVDDSDFSLKTIIGQVIDGLFNIDSKLLRSFKYLLLKPGQLTAKYIQGIRNPFMKPIQIFLIANILFFLLLTQADILRIPAKYFFNSGRNLNVEAKMDSSNQSLSEVMQQYDRISADLSKSLVIFIVPILALVLWVLNFNSKFLFGMHLIFSVHYLAFFFLCCLMAVTVSFFGNEIVQLFIIAINFIYLFIAMRQVYKNSIMMTIIKSGVLLFAFFGITILYRSAVSYVSFNFI